MGRIYLEHLGGSRLYTCGNCSTYLTSHSRLVSTRFTGATGPAFLFSKVVNVVYSQMQDREMLTGHHVVRDVQCKKCNSSLGWFYEYAMETPQKYKEGHVILEKALIEEMPGFQHEDNKDEEEEDGELQVDPL